MVRVIRGLVVAVAVCGFTPSLAMAQGSNWIADLVKRSGGGATVGWVKPTDSDVEVGTVWGVQFGLAPKPGWALSAGFGWFGADLFLPTQGISRRVGSLDFRPIMGGVSYTWVHGRLATSVALNAGISFNSATLSNDIRNQFPGAPLELDMKDSFVVRPSVEVEYALHPKFGLTGWLGYVYSQIDSSLTTPQGRIEDEWNASNVSISFGFMVYPFR